MVDHCDRDKGVTGFRAEGQGEAVGREELVGLCFLLGCLEEADRTVSTEHVKGWVDSHVLPISTSDVINC